MRKLILVAHTSLNGFVAGQKGELDGVETCEENLEFVSSLTGEADVALFGRVSYQLLDSYWPTARDRANTSRSEIKYSNWYSSAVKIVLSKTMTEVSSNNTTIVSGNIANKIIRIKEKEGKDILIFGSPATNQSVIQLDLVDSYWIFINPVIFNQAIPLFTGLKEK